MGIKTERREVEEEEEEKGWRRKKDVWVWEADKWKIV